jgi:hypothetical protein
MTISIHSFVAILRLSALCLAMAAAMAGLVADPVTAHELRPAIVTAEIAPSGEIEIRAALNLEAQIAEIGFEHTDTAQSDKSSIYDRLRAATPKALRAAFEPMAADLVEGLALAFDGAKVELTLRRVEVPAAGDLSIARVSTLVLAATAPAGAAAMTWTADTDFGTNVIRAIRAGDAKPFFSAYLRGGETSASIPLQGAIEQNTWSSLANYIAIGFEHIVPKGLDHILFVVGLFLLSPRLRALSWQVTGFTLAHSVTLALGIYGVVSVPPAIVEPLIAASIIFVAVENLFTDRLHRWRPVAVFGFGLLHGLGFAGVLSDVGLPRDQFVTGLIGFNVGVELGQLAVIAACFLGVGLWFRHRHWYRRAVAMPASLAVAVVAAYWFVERVA